MGRLILVLFHFCRTVPLITGLKLLLWNTLAVDGFILFHFNIFVIHDIYISYSAFAVADAVDQSLLFKRHVL